MIVPLDLLSCYGFVTGEIPATLGQLMEYSHIIYRISLAHIKLRGGFTHSIA